MMMMLVKLSEQSWVRLHYDAIKCTKEQFEEMWATYPTKPRNVIKMFNYTGPIPRHQQLFGEASYSFSGMTLEPDPIVPPFVERCLQYAREAYPEAKWNGALVNYYEDGEDYISPHADDEKDLMHGQPILSFSFGQERTFTIETNKHFKDAYFSKLAIPTKNGMAIVMGGSMQREFLHGIPKMTGKTVTAGRRVNVTVRAFRPIHKRAKMDTTSQIN